MADARPFSFTRIWARVGDLFDGILRQTAVVPHGVETDLPPDLRAELIERLRPDLARLEEMRLRVLDETDRRAVILAPAAAAAVFVGVLASGFGIISGLIFGGIGFFVGGFVAMGNRAEAYRQAVKDHFGTQTAGMLSGFTYEASPTLPLDRINGWRLFPDVTRADVQNRLGGTRDGRRFAISDLMIEFYRVVNAGREGTVAFMAVAVEFETTARIATPIVVTDRMARVSYRDAPAAKHGLAAVETGDAAFDEHYLVFAGDRGAAQVFLTPERRQALLALREVSAEGCPMLTLMPGDAAVLFPLRRIAFEFRVKPYWVPIDADEVLGLFASDLARRNRLLNAALALPL